MTDPVTALSADKATVSPDEARDRPHTGCPSSMAAATETSTYLWGDEGDTERRVISLGTAIPEFTIPIVVGGLPFLIEVGADDQRDAETVLMDFLLTYDLRPRREPPLKKT